MSGDSCEVVPFDVTHEATPYENKTQLTHWAQKLQAACKRTRSPVKVSKSFVGNLVQRISVDSAQTGSACISEGKESPNRIELTNRVRVGEVKDFMVRTSMAKQQMNALELRDKIDSMQHSMDEI